jgi:D-beta-D-heptose 7-phosphate kinase/D-beta-D-heptose 1-phosphate adenosyltransferase
MNNVYQLAQQKIVQRAQLVLEVERRQRLGERCVFTNGCFDLLHLGHIRYLQEARALGDFLVMGLNSDESTRQLKGPSRPLVPENERAEILAALQCIDYVTVFPELSANSLLDLLQPAIYVKGADYVGADGQQPDLARLPEAQSVMAYGGDIRFIAYLPHHSTTEMIAKIKHLP